MPTVDDHLNSDETHHGIQTHGLLEGHEDDYSDEIFVVGGGGGSGSIGSTKLECYLMAERNAQAHLRAPQMSVVVTINAQHGQHAEPSV